MTAAEIATAFDKMSDREALRLLNELSKRFSGCGYAYDDLARGIEEVADACAEDEGWGEFDRPARYLAEPMRFGVAA